MTQACAAGAPSVAPGPPPGAPRAAEPGGFLPAGCERRQGDVFEALQVSVIEKVGPRHVLTVPCEGTHRIYLKPSSTIDFGAIAGQRVCARYRYVDQVTRVQCVRPRFSPPTAPPSASPMRPTRAFIA